jgi:hypothetical protein
MQCMGASGLMGRSVVVEEEDGAYVVKRRGWCI